MDSQSLCGVNHSEMSNIVTQSKHSFAVLSKINRTYVSSQ